MQLAINGVEMTEMVFEIAEPSNMAAWVMATIAALLLILGLFLGWLAFSFGHPSVVLTDEDLRLNVPLYGRTIPNAEIAVNQARIVDLNSEPPLTPPIRNKWYWVARMPGRLVPTQEWRQGTCSDNTAQASALCSNNARLQPVV